MLLLLNTDNQDIFIKIARVMGIDENMLSDNALIKIMDIENVFKSQSYFIDFKAFKNRYTEISQHDFYENDMEWGYDSEEDLQDHVFDIGNDKFLIYDEYY